MIHKLSCFDLHPGACDCLGMLVLSGLPADQILGVVLTGRLPMRTQRANLMAAQPSG